MLINVWNAKKCQTFNNRQAIKQTIKNKKISTVSC